MSEDTKNITNDESADALVKVIKMLAPLNADERRRVLETAATFLKVKPGVVYR